MFDLIVVVSIGLGLAAACGFRVFVPMLCIAIAAKGEYLSLAEGFDWLATWPAICALLVATIFEIAGYYFPWVDNLLDTVATPAAIVAGAIVSAAAIQDINPFLKWSLVIIAGGGSAGAVKVGLAAVRVGSSGTTGGVVNPLVSTFELGASLVMSVLAVFLPILAGVLAILATIASLLMLWKFWAAWRSRGNGKNIATSDA